MREVNITVTHKCRRNIKVDFNKTGSGALEIYVKDYSDNVFNNYSYMIIDSIEDWNKYMKYDNELTNALNNILADLDITINQMTDWLEYNTGWTTMEFLRIFDKGGN